MAGRDDEWTTDANKAVRISICQPSLNDKPTALGTFNPEFTYSIFGDDQTIFRYQDLKIKLRFAAHDLYPSLTYSYGAKFRKVHEAEAVDIKDTFKNLLPEYAFENESDFNTRLRDLPSAADFLPPGELHKSYTHRGRNYEIYKSNLAERKARTVLERIQVVIPFFIEGGTAIPLDDEDSTLWRWNVFFVYERLQNPPVPGSSVYSVVGYAASYRFFPLLPFMIPTTSDASPESLLQPVSTSLTPYRARISQFLILPPHQHNSHGSHLYTSMMDYFLADTSCVEVTVEDPNELFDDLRDFCDYHRLVSDGAIESFKINVDIDAKLVANRIGVRIPTKELTDADGLAALCKKYKLAPRQFARLFELHTFGRIPTLSRQCGTARITRRAQTADPGDRAWYYWRLLVKQRLLKQHRDTLIQFDRHERIEKLEETATTVAVDYERLLIAIVSRGNVLAENGEHGGGSAERKERKRKAVIEDDDEEKADDADAESSEPERKKVRDEDLRRMASRPKEAHVEESSDT